MYSVEEHGEETGRVDNISRADHTDPVVTIKSGGYDDVGTIEVFIPIKIKDGAITFNQAARSGDGGYSFNSNIKLDPELSAKANFQPVGDDALYNMIIGISIGPSDKSLPSPSLAWAPLGVKFGVSRTGDAVNILQVFSMGSMEDFSPKNITSQTKTAKRYVNHPPEYKEGSYENLTPFDLNMGYTLGGIISFKYTKTFRLRVNRDKIQIISPSRN